MAFNPKTPNTKSNKVPKPNDPQINDHRQWISSHFNATLEFRNNSTKAYRYVDSDQWEPLDKQQVESEGRPALTFNKTLAQVEMVSGMQRSNPVEVIPIPRGNEDRRLSELAMALSKANNDFTRFSRTAARVFDDATICGLGVFEVLHKHDDADDLIWGDVTIEPIHPLSFIWDPWSRDANFQDREYVGKLDWLTEKEFSMLYPKAKFDIRRGEWLNEQQEFGFNQNNLGTPHVLAGEVFDGKAGRIRRLTLWYKEPIDIVVLANEMTGHVIEVSNRSDAKQLKRDFVKEFGRRAVEGWTVATVGQEFFIQLPNGQPYTNPATGQPQGFISTEQAQQEIEILAKQFSDELKDQLRVIKRTAKRPKWVEMSWWQILNQGDTPFMDRRYPFAPYVSRQFSNAPSSIQGIVLPIIDAQDEWNKRYSNLLAHLNSSCHSGWLVRSDSGVDIDALQLLGQKPGAVIEYSNIPPERITPTQLSSGHFQLLQVSDANIRMITGLNSATFGIADGEAISGRAKRADQFGSATIMQPRFANWQECLLDVEELKLSRIQQFYPPEKMARIVGLAESRAPLGPNGQSIFTGMSDEAIYDEFIKLKRIKFDLVLDVQPFSPSDRQIQFEKAIEMLGIISATGRVPGPDTVRQIVEVSGLPQRLVESMILDLQQEIAQTQDQAQLVDQTNRAVSNIRGGRAGGNLGGAQEARPF